MVQQQAKSWSKPLLDFHKMEYNDILSNCDDDDLSRFYDRFHSELKANKNIHELSLDDIESLKSTLNNLFNIDINMPYPKT